MCNFASKFGLCLTMILALLIAGAAYGQARTASESNPFDVPPVEGLVDLFDAAPQDDPLDEPVPQEGEEETDEEEADSQVADLSIHDRTLLQLRESTNLEFQDSPVEEALDVIAQQHQLKYVLDRFALEAASIDPEQPVTISLSDVPLETAMHLLLRPLGMRFLVRDGVVIFTSDEAADTDLMSRLFSVQDLIHPDSEETSADRLIQVITTTIEPESWADNGGNGNIAYYQGAFIVANRYDVLREIEGLLSELQQHVAQYGGPRAETVAEATGQEAKTGELTGRYSAR
jgi:type II secretory pathway component HofQ